MSTEPVRRDMAEDSAAWGTRRRTLFVGAGAVGAGVLLAGCGDDGDPGDAETGDGVLARAGEVEVGGGHINGAENVVVTQPSEGDFRGFSATCTHEGCTVSSVSDGTINCACHGSRFSIEDGSLVQPAIGMTAESQDPLPRVEVAEDNGTIVRA